MTAAADQPRTPVTLDAHLDEQRSQYERLDPAAAASAVEHGAILVDIRPSAQRIAEGAVPGALVVERNVLEWRLAPSSDHRLPNIDAANETVIIMCSGGYASSLAAVSLRTVGVAHATDLAGGFQAWKAAGLPTAPAIV